MAIERQRVTKRREQHPAEALADPMSKAPESTPTPPAPEPAPTSAATRRDTTHRTASRAPAAKPDERSGGEDSPKVPTSYRLPRALLNRLDKGARVIPAALDLNVSKNQIVEMAIDEYLQRFDV